MIKCVFIIFEKFRPRLASRSRSRSRLKRLALNCSQPLQFAGWKWNKMALQTMFLLCSVLALSARFPTQAYQRDSGHLHHHRSRSHRGAQRIKYDLEKTQPTPIPEDAKINTVLFDLNSINFDDEPAASFRFQVITTDDSVPNRANLFTVDEFRLLKFNQISDPKSFFDYEKHPTIVVIIQATSMAGRTGK